MLLLHTPSALYIPFLRPWETLLLYIHHFVSLNMAVSMNHDYWNKQNSWVYQFRIEFHTLGPSFVRELSENHVTITFLLGDGESVNANMQPLDLSMVGELVLKGHNYIRSRRTLRVLDVNCRGCPAAFDPEDPPPRTATVVTVAALVSSMQSRGLLGYRYTNIENAGEGCRFWVSVNPPILS